jgi:hypothetical protein
MAMPRFDDSLDESRPILATVSPVGPEPEMVVRMPESGAVESVLVAAGYDGYLDLSLRYDDEGNLAQIALLDAGNPIARILVTERGFLTTNDPD